MANPTLLTYIGGSRSRRNGIFAGVADIQGMDMLVHIIWKLTVNHCIRTSALNKTIVLLGN